MQRLCRGGSSRDKVGRSGGSHREDAALHHCIDQVQQGDAEPSKLPDLIWNCLRNVPGSDGCYHLIGFDHQLPDLPNIHFRSRGREGLAASLKRNNPLLIEPHPPPSTHGHLKEPLRWQKLPKESKRLATTCMCAPPIVIGGINGIRIGFGILVSGHGKLFLPFFCQIVHRCCAL